MTTGWLILTATLPTSPSGLRVRVWRALKATGAGTLREGVYVLPDHAPSAQALWELEHTIGEAGADAHLLIVQARDAAQEQAFRALFDRSALHANFMQSLKEARARIKRSSADQLKRLLRTLETQLRSLEQIDFFPGPSSRKAVDSLASFRREVERHLSPDEPAASGAAIVSRAIDEYQGRTWATRRRPWVDRLGTAWLIHRFIDKQPRFIWLADPTQCPQSALGYDFDGATFTHVGDKVTFEVVATSFGLMQDPALQRLAALVHGIDIGGIPVDEAPGFELLVRGLQVQHAHDDELLAAALPVFDACYAAFQVNHDE